MNRSLPHGTKKRKKSNPLGIKHSANNLPMKLGENGHYGRMIGGRGADRILGKSPHPRLKNAMISAPSIDPVPGSACLPQARSDEAGLQAGPRLVPVHSRCCARRARRITALAIILLTFYIF